MIAFLPIDIETADLQSSIVIDYDSAEYGADWQGEWSAGSYDEGDVVYKGVELYEALTNTSDDPEDGVDAGPWAKFPGGGRLTNTQIQLVKIPMK